jgi:ankyrin repeat protein
MHKTTITACLATATLCLASLPPLTAQPAANSGSPIPHMTRAEGLAYLHEQAHDLDVDATNLVSPMLSGEIDTVEALLAAGVDANDRALPRPALELAAATCADKRVDERGTLTLIEVLLAHGAKINPPGATELSPLMVAAQHCSAAVVRRFLRAGADLHFHTSLGIAPLSMALIIRNYDAAGALVDAGARLSPEAAAKLLTGKNNDPRLVALVKRARAK